MLSSSRSGARGRREMRVLEGREIGDTLAKTRLALLAEDNRLRAAVLALERRLPAFAGYRGVVHRSSADIPAAARAGIAQRQARMANAVPTRVDDPRGLLLAVER